MHYPFFNETSRVQARGISVIEQLDYEELFVFPRVLVPAISFCYNKCVIGSTVNACANIVTAFEKCQNNLISRRGKERLTKVLKIATLIR